MTPTEIDRYLLSQSDNPQTQDMYSSHDPSVGCFNFQYKESLCHGYNESDDIDVGDLSIEELQKQDGYYIECPIFTTELQVCPQEKVIIPILVDSSTKMVDSSTKMVDSSTKMVDAYKNASEYGVKKELIENTNVRTKYTQGRKDITIAEMQTTEIHNKFLSRFIQFIKKCIFGYNEKPNKQVCYENKNLNEKRYNRNGESGRK